MYKKILNVLLGFANVMRAAIVAIGLLLILGYMVWFNYTVDRSGLFQGKQYERDIVNMLLNKTDILGYEMMDERQISKLMVLNMDEAPQTIALGSSRILQLTKDELKSSDFFNFGMIGADYRDIMSTYYLFKKADKLPQNIIIGFDPWYLNKSGVDERSDAELYSEFLNYIGESAHFDKKKENGNFAELFSPAYFQGCVEYFYRDKTLEKHPSPVKGDILSQPTEIKRGDGSVLYIQELRMASLEQIQHSAMLQAATFLRMEDYNAPDQELIKIFDKFLKLAKERGSNVIFVLTPYQHTLWDIVSRQQSKYPGFFDTEMAVRKLASKNDIPVYGSYNPYAISALEPADFYDGIHIRAQGIAKFFPGIDKVVFNIENNIKPELPKYDIAGMPAEGEEDSRI